MIVVSSSVRASIDFPGNNAGFQVGNDSREVKPESGSLVGIIGQLCFPSKVITKLYLLEPADDGQLRTEKEKRSFKSFCKKIKNIIKQILDTFPLASKYTRGIKDRFKPKDSDSKNDTHPINTLNEAMKALDADLAKIGSEVDDLGMDFDLGMFYANFFLSSSR